VIGYKDSSEEANRGKGIVSRKPRQKSAYDFLGLFIASIVLFYYVFVLSPAPT